MEDDKYKLGQKNAEGDIFYKGIKSIIGQLAEVYNNKMYDIQYKEGYYDYVLTYIEELTKEQ